jgi:hypothetical protein
MVHFCAVFCVYTHIRPSSPTRTGSGQASAILWMLDRQQGVRKVSSLSTTSCSCRLRVNPSHCPPLLPTSSFVVTPSALSAFWFVGALFGYSFAAEKMPWLNVHLTLVTIVLAAYTLKEIWVWAHRREWRLSAAPVEEGPFNGRALSDYYNVLQVAPNVDREAIEAAYGRLAAKYHPDVYAGADAATDARAEEAFDILHDPIGALVRCRPPTFPNLRVRRERSAARQRVARLAPVSQTWPVRHRPGARRWRSAFSARPAPRWPASW